MLPVRAAITHVVGANIDASYVVYSDDEEIFLLCERSQDVALSYHKSLGLSLTETNT